MPIFIFPHCKSMATTSCHSNQEFLSDCDKKKNKKQCYSFPLPIDAICEIWQKSASWLQRRYHLKMLTDRQRVPGYTISSPMRF